MTLLDEPSRLIVYMIVIIRRAGSCHASVLARTCGSHGAVYSHMIFVIHVNRQRPLCGGDRDCLFVDTAPGSARHGLPDSSAWRGSRGFSRSEVAVSSPIMVGGVLNHQAF
jgi:hypothetical protein